MSADLARRLDHDWFDRELPPGVAWGEGAWLHSSYGFLHCRSRRPEAVRIGAHSGVYEGSYFELGPHGRVEIGDYCSIVGAIIRSDGLVRIGSYSFVAHEVVFADAFDAEPPAEAPRDAAPAEDETPRIELGENCWVGTRAVLLAGTRLGEGCVVGAGAVVSFAAPAFSIVAGNPARVVGRAH